MEYETHMQLSQVSDQCFGLALAPGELMVAVVSSISQKIVSIFIFSAIYLCSLDAHKRESSWFQFLYIVSIVFYLL